MFLSERSRPTYQNNQIRIVFIRIAIEVSETITDGGLERPAPTDWFVAALPDAQGLPRKSTNTHTSPLSNVDSSPEPPKHGYGTG